MAGGGQNTGLSFEELYDEARQSVPELERLGGGMLDDLSSQFPDVFDSADFEMGPLKTIERAMEKIEGDYGGDHSKISDLVRGRIVVDSPEQVEAIRAYLAENAEELGIEQMKDRFAKPSDTGFRDINMKLRLPGGHVAEFRVEHRGVMEAAKNTHEPYERVQEIERRATMENRPLNAEERLERQQILDDIRDIHNAPAQEAGLDGLLNEDGRARMAEHEAERVTPSATAGADAPRMNGSASETLAAVPDTPADVPDAAVAAQAAPGGGGLGGYVADAARMFSKVAKLLGPLGAVGAGIEAFVLGREAQAAVADGEISQEALAEYAAVLTAHTSQATFDPTLVGGEVPVQAWYDDFVERHGLSPEMAERLEPSSLLEDIAGSPQVSAEQQLFVTIYDALPAELDESMSPEMQTLVQMKQQVEAAQDSLDHARSTPITLGSDGMLQRQEAQTRLAEAEQRFAQQYEEFAQNASLQEHVMADLGLGEPAMPEPAPDTQPEPAESPAVASTERQHDTMTMG